MFKLFERRYTENNQVIQPRGIDLIKRTYRLEVSRIRHYYNSRVKHVRGNHLFVRFLRIAMPNEINDLEVFSSKVNSSQESISKFFKFVSPIEYGTIYEDLFYKGPNIVMANEEPFNPFKESKNWKDINPIKVLKHPVSSLSLLLPYPERFDTVEEGLSVVSVNVPLLLLMYRGFLLDPEIEGEVLGPNAFIMMYLLPSMLETQTDLVFFNRLQLLSKDVEPNNDENSKHPFSIMKYERKVDRALKEVIKYSRKRNMDYFTYLKLIPSIFKEDGQESYLVPRIAKTRQSFWASYLSRLDMIMFLIFLGEEEGLRRNRKFITKAKITVKRFLQDSVFEKTLPLELYQDTKEKLDKILET